MAIKFLQIMTEDITFLNKLLEEIDWITFKLILKVNLFSLRSIKLIIF